MDGLMGDVKKIRKRGCSPSSSTSSVMQNYKFKRAILVRKKGGSGGGGGGGSTTPVPTWRMVGSRSPSVVLRVAAASPRYPPSLSGRSRSGQGQGNGQQPVSARKLAATLWEMNEVPSPSPSLRVGRRDKIRRSWNNSASLPPHLSDPSHSPVSERMERSGTGSHRRRESSISRKLKNDHFDSVSNASFMEIETRSRCQTPSGSAAGGRTRLKDVSNALTTSKELLKIISRMWGHEDQPSSSMSLISALHAELERARLQINQVIQEDRSDSKEINYLLKRFAEEKAAWKNKEQEAVEAAVESIAGELEVERKLRRQFESLNKKLGKELSETKLSFLKTVKELQSEKRARGIIEQVCDELAGNIGEDKAQVAEMKRESLRMQEDFQKEREMLQIAEALREERAQMKLSDAKHQFEEKNAVVDKLRNKLETFLRTNSSKDNGCGSVYQRRDVDLAFCRSQAKESDGEEVENTTDDDDGENSGESDLHSIDLNMEDPYKSNYNLMNASMTPKKSKRHSVDEQLKGRKSLFNQVARRSTSLLRSVSNIVEWGNGSSHEIDKQIPRKSCGDEIQRHKSGRGSRDHALPSSRLGLEKELASPSSQRGSPWPSRDPCNLVLQRPMMMEGSGTRGRVEESRVQGHNSRRSKR
ncbi:hypothetical protein BVRB_7g158620 [Beta vulgaris subsp. vulgaris]|nr:hypothetical protein BVRB_7g158620 [Beta vulgaris subsp. vulgaris]